MDLIASLILNAYGTSMKDHSQPDINDKIFKVRQDMKKQVKYDNTKLTDSENNTFYTHENKGKREHHIRKILQELYGHPFASCRPSWLINHKTKRKLEIDCYNADLRIGVEVDGEFHARYMPHFHKTWEKYCKQVERDLLKTKMIEERGITFVRVPHHIPTNLLEKYLMEQLWNKKSHR